MKVAVYTLTAQVRVDAEYSVELNTDATLPKYRLLDPAGKFLTNFGFLKDVGAEIERVIEHEMFGFENAKLVSAVGMLDDVEPVVAAEEKARLPKDRYDVDSVLVKPMLDGSFIYYAVHSNGDKTEILRSKREFTEGNIYLRDVKSGPKIELKRKFTFGKTLCTHWFGSSNNEVLQEDVANELTQHFNIYKMI